MFDDKLKRARQLIEKRDQIDEEWRALFGEAPQSKRSRRQLGKENGSALSQEKKRAHLHWKPTSSRKVAQRG